MTVSEFYRTKEWRALIAFLRLERVDENGNIICEHCRKPIVKAYDCIGHHKEELTVDNVSNASIALNPDNIALVHHKCHNRIHNKLSYSCKQVFVVYGSPLSGKSTWVKENSRVGDLIIDVDAIWQCVSACKRYEKPAVLKSTVFKVRDTLIDTVKVRSGKWHNAYIIGGYPFSAERERLIKSLGAREIFINTNKEECLKRLHNDPSGRNISEWEKYICDWWDKYTPLTVN